MDIKDGEIITLENGDKVKVSLELIESGVKELIVGKLYKLRWNGQFCHAYNRDGHVNDITEHTFQYIGIHNLKYNTTRYIFISNDNNCIYCMISTNNLDFIIKQID